MAKIIDFVLAYNSRGPRLRTLKDVVERLGPPRIYDFVDGYIYKHIDEIDQPKHAPVLEHFLLNELKDRQGKAKLYRKNV